MDNATDYEIARRLAEQGYKFGDRDDGVSSRLKVEVWCRGRVEAVWKFYKEYGKSDQTLYNWSFQVQEAINKAKGITAPIDKPKRRNPFKRTLATGHKTRESDDPTPQSKCPDEVSSWNEARLKLVGAVDRHSRKRK